jgi:hypothetical protein
VSGWCRGPGAKKIIACRVDAGTTSIAPAATIIAATIAVRRTAVSPIW